MDTTNLEHLHNIRRTATKGRDSSQEKGDSQSTDLFQHILDELSRVGVYK